jgi:hypothetical protein
MKLSDRLNSIISEKRGDKGDVLGNQGNPARLKVLDAIDDLLSDKDYWYLAINSSHGEKITTSVSHKAASKYGDGIGKKFDAKKFSEKLSSLSGTKWKPEKGNGADWEFVIDENITNNEDCIMHETKEGPSLIEEIESILGGNTIVVNLSPVSSVDNIEEQTKSVISDEWVKKVTHLTDINNHVEARLEAAELAKKLGSDKFLKIFDLISQLYKLAGESPNDLSKYEYSVSKDMRAYLKSKLSEEDYQKFVSAF